MGLRPGSLSLGLAGVLFLAVQSGGFLVVPDSSWLDAHARRAALVTNGFTLRNHVAVAGRGVFSAPFIR